MKFITLNFDDYKRVFVTSDIHGNIDLFNKLIHQIHLQKDDILLILGDSCDRGKDTRAVYNKVIQLKNDYNVIHLLGNHESMLLESYVHDEKNDRWKRNGCASTLKSYPDGIIDKSHIELMQNMPMGIESKDYYLVHAGIQPDVKSLQKQTYRDLIWIREPFLSEPLKTQKTVIFGHTINKSGKIEQLDNQKIAIDCGSYVNGTLGCLEIKSMDKIYIKDRCQ